MTPASDVLSNTLAYPSELERVTVENAIWQAQNADNAATSTTLAQTPTPQMASLLVQYGYMVEGSTVIWTNNDGIIPPQGDDPEPVAS